MLLSSETSSWQDEMRHAFRDVDQLAHQLGLSQEWLAGARRTSDQFPLFAPRPFVRRIRHGDPHDPLLRQVAPSELEDQDVAGFTADPVGDLSALAMPGVVQKYAGRALLVLSGACAIHCRYCFRRHFPYGDAPRGVELWSQVIQDLANERDVEEIILSGGDPLTLRDESLLPLLEQIRSLSQIRRLRIHTRLPVVIPQRVTASLLDALAAWKVPPVVVVHVNHPQEVDGAVEEVWARFRQAGVVLLNQTVLLRGVNDQVDTLVELSRVLIEHGVMPYYLHQLDRVAGAAHFEVAESVGSELLRGLRNRMPGYAVPRYVRDEPGRPSKVWLA